MTPTSALAAACAWALRRIAAVRRMVREGQLGPRSRVVVFNTATGLRYPHLLDGPVPVVPAAGSIDDATVARAAAARTGGAPLPC